MKWRKEALVEINHLENWDSLAEFTEHRRETAQRILTLTQVLTDLYLLREYKAAERVLKEKED
jgi:hypothetical protein